MAAPFRTVQVGGEASRLLVEPGAVLVLTSAVEPLLVLVLLVAGLVVAAAVL